MRGLSWLDVLRVALGWYTLRVWQSGPAALWPPYEGVVAIGARRWLVASKHGMVWTCRGVRVPFGVEGALMRAASRQRGA